MIDSALFSKGLGNIISIGSISWIYFATTECNEDSKNNTKEIMETVFIQITTIS